MSCSFVYKYNEGPVSGLPMEQDVGIDMVTGADGVLHTLDTPQLSSKQKCFWKAFTL